MQLRPVYAAVAFVFAALRKQWAITVSAALPAVFTGHSLELPLIFHVRACTQSQRMHAFCAFYGQHRGSLSEAVKENSSRLISLHCHFLLFPLAW